jgi:hypothetical protein
MKYLERLFNKSFQSKENNNKNYETAPHLSEKIERKSLTRRLNIQPSQAVKMEGLQSFKAEVSTQTDPVVTISLETAPLPPIFTRALAEIKQFNPQSLLLKVQ